MSLMFYVNIVLTLHNTTLRDVLLLPQSGSGRQHVTGPGRLCTCAGRQLTGFRRQLVDFGCVNLYKSRRK